MMDGGFHRRHSTATVALLAGIVIGAVASLAAVTLTSWGGQTAPLSAADSAAPVHGAAYPGEPAAEADLVAVQKKFLNALRTATSAATWQFRAGLRHGPYLLDTLPTPTLVLPERLAPYTVSDLATVIPDAFTQQDATTYLLADNIAILTGAQLSLTQPEGLTVRLKSSPNGAASIIGFGGTLEISGSTDALTTITSWDPSQNTPDITTSDGRSYIRLEAGRAELSHTLLEYLGFWSGQTGGLALVGAKASRTSDGKVTAAINDATITGNAFGMFISGAKQISVTDTDINDSLSDGLVLHRSVTSATILRTTANDNGTDGMSVDRSSSHVRLIDVTTSGNGRDGITVDGRALAAGPNASGASPETYGDIVINSAVSRENAHDGITIRGGQDISVTNSDVSENFRGVVVDFATENVTIGGNEFNDNRGNAIALRDGVTGATINGNTVNGGGTGVHLRNAHATISNNSIADVKIHGVSVAGDAADTTIEGNQIAGTGTSAVWTDSATGVTVSRNAIDQWHPTPTLARVAKTVFQPMTTVWIALGLLLLLAAVTHRGKQFGQIRDPYPERVPLRSLTRGTVTRDSIGTS